MTVKTGYTALQAKRLTDAIDGDVAKAEEIIEKMLSRVTDVQTVTADVLTRDLRFRADGLKDVVRRRTRS